MNVSKFRVVEFKFNPSAVGKERQIEVMGKMTNIPQTTAGTARTVKDNLSESQAKTLCERLNDQQSLKSDVEVMLTYVVRSAKSAQETRAA